MKFGKLLFMLAISAGFIVAQGSDVFAQLVVDDDGRATFNNCNASAPTFNTIQGAVNAAVPGTIIRVCPGTYQEQVNISGPGKNNITLISVVRLAAIIKAPAISAPALPFDIVTVNNARDVSLVAFTITGPFPDTSFCNEFLISGVRIIGNGSANIVRNKITEMRSANPALRGCQNGFAIAVGRTFELQTGQANIIENLIEKYQKGGIYVDNVGSAVRIADNDIRGEAALNTIAQNGIQISRGATADIRRNRISDNVYITPVNSEATSASAVIIFEAGQVSAERNRLFRNQDGFAVFTADGNVTISDNRIIGGILPFPVELGVLNFGDGIFMNADTLNNRLLRNFLRDNSEHDCHDDSVGLNNPPALVANIWRGNDGLTENKPGLCRQGGNGGGDGDDDNDDDDNDDDDGDDDDEGDDDD